MDIEDWAGQQSKKLADRSRRILKAPAWNLQNSFYQKLHNQEKRKNEKEDLKHNLLLKFDYFKILSCRINKLLVEMENIKI